MNEAVHKGSHAKKYLINAPWYLLSSIVTKGAHFFLLPIYTRYILPEDYGILSNLESFGRVLPIFLSLYLDAAFGRFYFKEKESPERIRTLFSTHFWFLIMWGSIISLVFIIFSPYLFKYLLGISILPIVIVIITSLLSQLSVMVSMIWRARLLAMRISLFQIFMSAFGIAISLYLLIAQDMNWQSRVIGTASVSILEFIILTFVAIKNKWLVFSFNSKIIARSLIFSIPLIPNIAAGWISGFSDRIIMAYYGKLGEAGLYSIAASFTMLLYIFNDAITQVQAPVAISGLTDDKKQAKKSMESFLILFTGVMSVLYLCLALFSKEFLSLFTDIKYHEAYKLIAILGPIYIFSGIYRVFTVMIGFHGIMWVISGAAIIQAILNIILNLTFIPIFGMYAAAYSTLLSMFAYTCFIVWRSQSKDPININYKPYLYLFLIVLITITINYNLNLIIIIQWRLTIIKFVILLTSIFAIFTIPDFKVIINKSINSLFKEKSIAKN